jgi:hypothetical protein
MAVSLFEEPVTKTWEVLSLLKLVCRATGEEGIEFLAFRDGHSAKRETEVLPQRLPLVASRGGPFSGRLG